MPKQTMKIRFDRVGANIKPRALDGRDLPNWREGPIMAEYLRHLRREGWRLITLESADCALLQRDRAAESRRARVARFLAARRRL